MNLPLLPPYPPMEAQTADAIPPNPEGKPPKWQYEPKWDGFRCVAFRDGSEVELQSKSCQPLARYFPEVVEAVCALKTDRFVLDGELVIPVGDGLSFDDLLQRIHPAASRVKKLAAETPAIYVVFDLLVDADGELLTSLPLPERRQRLEAFMDAAGTADDRVRLSPATTDYELAQQWFEGVGGALDGVMAKRTDVAYMTGERKGMQKIKSIRTVDCVVGGFRYATNKKVVGSLLLGLYDDEGLLHHVGFTSGIKDADKAEMTALLEPLIKPPGFTGKAPGGPSRWSTDRSAEWQPLAPDLVVEVTYDHFTGGRFRHGTNLRRWRPDKDPKQCTIDQAKTGASGSLRMLESA